MKLQGKQEINRKEAFERRRLEEISRFCWLLVKERL